MPRNKKGRDLDKWRSTRPETAKGCVRVIGGEFKGKSLVYSGDKVTRPMKDSIREALFNLVGGYLDNTIAIDLFAGTGVVGLEAISRGSIHALLIERHVPTTKIIRQNVETLGATDNCTIAGSDTFYWGRQFKKEIQSGNSISPRLSGDWPASLLEHPWAIFCCPPYDFYVDRCEELMNMLSSLTELSPPGSLMVVESDARFDQSLLPESQSWNIREYSPAVVAIRKGINAPETNVLDVAEIAEAQQNTASDPSE